MKTKKKSDSRRRGLALAATIGAPILAVLAWFFWPGADAEVAALEKEREHVFSGEATREERDAFRQRVDQLTDAQRRQLFDRGRPEMRERMTQWMNELMSLPPEELQREVERRADAVMKVRTESRTDGDRGGGPPRGGPGRGGTDAQRDQRRKEMLDRIPPTARAQFSEMRGMVNQELARRGQDPVSGREMRAMMGRPQGPPRG